MDIVRIENSVATNITTTFPISLKAKPVILCGAWCIKRDFKLRVSFTASPL